MDFETYRKAYYTAPQPEPRFDFGGGIRGAVLYYEDYPGALDFYTRVFGPPNYKEGETTHGWRLGESWLTLFPSKAGSPANIEVPFYLPSRESVDALYAALIEAGAQGEPPSENLMYRPVYIALVTDPFGATLMLVCEVG
jgi:uncharacterized glyoxalase superfamily protein PhnB